MSARTEFSLSAAIKVKLFKFQFCLRCYLDRRRLYSMLIRPRRLLGWSLPVVCQLVIFRSMGNLHRLCLSLAPDFTFFFVLLRTTRHKPFYNYQVGLLTQKAILFREHRHALVAYYWLFWAKTPYISALKESAISHLGQENHWLQTFDQALQEGIPNTGAAGSSFEDRWNQKTKLLKSDFFKCVNPQSIHRHLCPTTMHADSSLYSQFPSAHPTNTENFILKLS